MFEGLLNQRNAFLDALAQLHEDLAEGRISLDMFEERQEQLRSNIRVD